MSFVSCQQQPIIVLLISNSFISSTKSDTVPTTPKMSFIVGIKMTKMLRKNRIKQVNRIWRRKSNCVLLTISNKDARTCRKRRRERVLCQEQSINQFKASCIYFNWFFMQQQALHRSIRNFCVSDVMPFEIILKINLIFQNCRYTCICSKIFLPF